MTTLLAATDLRATLAKREILHGISLKIEAASFTAVIGPNGAGKSTLLKALAGVIPTHGVISRPSRIAYLPQDGTIAWPMPVRDIVALGRARFGGLRSLISESDLAIIDKTISACALESLADLPATELSGGETARVLLARALAVQAPLLLLDEPVSALDPAHQLGTIELLRQEVAKGHAVVAVMHDLGLALQHASRLLVVDQGSLLADDYPEQILKSGLLDRVFGIQLQTLHLDGGLRLTGFRRR